MVARLLRGRPAAARRGVAEGLLAAAVEHAFARGASSLASYPPVSDPHDYMGHVALFEAAGVAKVRDANKRAILGRERPRA